MLHHFLDTIDRVKALEIYNALAIGFKAPRMKELPSVEEYLALISNKPAEVKNSFDPEVDKILEAHALKLLHERRG